MEHPGDSNTKPRRKKVSRACSHCQKAHLTCDEGRPCQRCIKRGLENTCMDGSRKRAKYLQGDDEQEESTMNSPSSSSDYNRNETLSNNNKNNNNNNINNNLDAIFQLLYANGNDTIIPPPLPQQQHQYQLPAYPFQQQQQQQQQFPQTMSPALHESLPASTRVIKGRKGVGMTPEEIYARVKTPFNYAEGYHYLFQHVRQRMGPQELMRISRALALFRPSFIASMIDLTEEDLIYMEKCVQRSVLEYEKLISFSGTPTAVWRRTGEIVLVGKEFSLLTQWSKDTLLGKRTFIYELMDNGSVVEYWEKYGEHAFSDTESSSAYMSVILMSPTMRPIPCAFCFTIKRDIFDLPSVVVGNFLPILTFIPENTRSTFA